MSIGVYRRRVVIYRSTLRSTRSTASRGGKMYFIALLGRLPSSGGLDRQRREAAHRPITMIWDDFWRAGKRRRREWRRQRRDCRWTRIDQTNDRENSLWLLLLASLLRPSSWIDYARLHRRRRRQRAQYSTQCYRYHTIRVHIAAGLLKAIQYAGRATALISGNKPTDGRRRGPFRLPVA